VKAKARSVPKRLFSRPRQISVGIALDIALDISLGIAAGLARIAAIAVSRVD
jgi:hypothetical protein